MMAVGLALLWRKCAMLDWFGLFVTTGTAAVVIGAAVLLEGWWTGLHRGKEPHPEVVRWADGQPWPAGKPFPLTPLEAWYVMQGYTVKPTVKLSSDEFKQLPGSLQGGPDGVMLRQS